MRRVLLQLVSVVAVVSAGVIPIVTAKPAGAAISRPFTIVYQTTDRGDIALIGNTNEICPASTTCTNALAGIGSTLNNNDFDMTYVDVDSDPSTFNSSSADLGLPSGSTVKFAGLYWSARTQKGTNGADAPGQSNQIRLKVPGGAYQTITASRIDLSGSGGTYQSIADITNIVKAAGNGTYVAANLAAATGRDRYAGWSLVVVYENPAKPLRNLTVFDGFGTVVQNETVPITISGFLTPPAGAVNVDVGVVAYEGDRGYVGDRLKLNGTDLSDALNPANNFFNSTADNLGVNNTARNPANLNLLGHDVDLVRANGILPNSATTATVTLNSANETYYPGVVTTAIDAYQPNVELTKTVTDLNGGSTVPGDVLQFTMTTTNDGLDTAKNAVLSDPIPDGSEYVPGSLVVSAGANAGAKTDAFGDDQGWFDSATNSAKFNLGTGATPTAGGTLGINSTTTVTFQARVTVGGAGGVIDNIASVGYTNNLLGTPGVATAEASIQVVPTEADLAITKTGSPGSIIAGSGDVTYELVVKNNGPADAEDAVVTDTLPPGMSVASANATTGTCADAGTTVTCNLGTIPNGGQITIWVVAAVDADATGTLTNQASVTSQTFDPNPANNSDSANTVITTSADLAIVKVSDSPTAVAGDPITYTLTVVNNGPSDAVDTQVVDTLPNAVAFTSATPSTGSCNESSGIVTCDLGTLAFRETVTIEIVGTVDAGFGGGQLVNTATVDATTVDPDPSDNTATYTSDSITLADVSIRKEANKAVATAGRNLTWTITVSNTGPSTANDVTVNDTLPNGTSILNVTSSQGSCTGTTAIACSLGTLANGAEATITLQVKVDPSLAPGLLTNEATVTTSSPEDPTDSNNRVKDPIEVANDAIVGVVKTADQASVVAGNNVTYTLVATNAGPSDAIDATVTDVLPDDLEYVSASPASGSCEATGQIITCDLGTLTPNESRSIALVARVKSSALGGTLTNRAQSTSVTPSSGGPGESTTDITVTTVTDLVIAKRGPSTTIDAGRQFDWTITVTNNGPSDAVNVVVTDALTGGTTPVGATPTQGTCDISGVTVTCDLGTLTNGTTATITLTVTAPSTEGDITNTASVGTDTATGGASVTVASAGVSVLPSGSGGELPRTGSESKGAVAFGCFAVGLGLLFVVHGRRRFT